MRSKNSLGAFLLFLTALIWGLAFVAQTTGVEVLPPFSFNGLRSFLGFGVLMLFLALRAAFTREKREHFFTKWEWLGGLCCGLVLFLASSLQQVALVSNSGTSAGKVAFLTSLYVAFVPVLSLFLKKHAPLRVWLGVLCAVLGAMLLSLDLSAPVAFSRGDLLALACAAVFAVHILVIDLFLPHVDGVRMSALQFLVVGLCSLPVICFADRPTLSDIGAVALPLCYTGILSSGVAYTLQIVGQKYCAPAPASIILCLESVFGALGGAVILGWIGGDASQLLSLREIAGCVVVFFAVVFTQLAGNTPRTNKPPSDEACEK